ncbi:MAG TPA: hypothetical protein VFP60_06070 [Pseudolabrys sp.]|nr:hypothetical protein [Pseudolabrys sp.]
MKVAIFAIAAASLAAATIAYPTFAQNSSQNSGRGQDDQPFSNAPSGRGMGSPMMRHHFDGTSGRAAEDRDEDADRAFGRDDRRNRRMGGGGTRFRFVRGNARIDIRCSEREQLQACVDAATRLLKEISQLRERRDSGTSGSDSGSSDDADDQNGEEPDRL